MGAAPDHVSPPVSLIVPLKQSGKTLASLVGGLYFREKGALKGTAIALVTVIGIYLIGK